MLCPGVGGGSDDLRNLVLACNTCNIRKLDRDVDALIGFGHETLAQKVECVLAMRANWGPDEVKARLAIDVPGTDPGHDNYEKFITETPTAKVINAALTHAGLSNETLRRRAGLGGWTLDRYRKETQNPSVTMCYKLSQATGYPMDEFLKIYRGWLSAPGTPQRALEYAFALQGLTIQRINKAVLPTQGYLNLIIKGIIDMNHLSSEEESGLRTLAHLDKKTWNRLKTEIAQSATRPAAPRWTAETKKGGRRLGLFLPGLAHCETWTARLHAYETLFDTKTACCESIGIPLNVYRRLSLFQTFPSCDAFTTICEALNEKPFDVLHDIEREWTTHLGITYPAHLVPATRLETRLYLLKQPKQNLAKALGLQKPTISQMIRENLYESAISGIAHFLKCDADEARASMLKSHIIYRGVRAYKRRNA